MARARRNAESYRSIAANLSAMRMEALAFARDTRGTRADAIDELSRSIAGACFDHLSITEARDLARWAGARRRAGDPSVGRMTYTEAHNALSRAWFDRADLQRAARAADAKPRTRTRWNRAALAMRAHEHNRSIADQLAAELRDAEISAIVHDRAAARAALARFVTARANSYTVLRAA